MKTEKKTTKSLKPEFKAFEYVLNGRKKGFDVDEYWKLLEDGSLTCFRMKSTKGDVFGNAHQDPESDEMFIIFREIQEGKGNQIGASKVSFKKEEDFKIKFPANKSKDLIDYRYYPKSDVFLVTTFKEGGVYNVTLSGREPEALQFLYDSIEFWHEDQAFRKASRLGEELQD